jgi:[ribosomal protein S5]-alanine N-acetyltransferase
MISEDFPALTSQRLEFIEIREQHKEDLFRIFGDKLVVEYYNLQAFDNPEDSMKLIDWFTKRRTENLGIRWGIVEKNSKEIIGTIGFNNFAENHRASIGYDLRSDRWGKGIMQEALETIIDFGFDKLKVNRIEAEVMAGNSRSEKLLEKLQFRKEGLLRSWMYWQGRHYNMNMFALLKSDWKEHRK